MPSRRPDRRPKSLRRRVKRWYKDLKSNPWGLLLPRNRDPLIPSWRMAIFFLLVATVFVVSGFVLLDGPHAADPITQ